MEEQKVIRIGFLEAARKSGFQYIEIQHFLIDDKMEELRIITDTFC